MYIGVIVVFAHVKANIADKSAHSSFRVENKLGYYISYLFHYIA